MKIKTIIVLSLLSTVPFSSAYAADVVSSFEPTLVVAPFSWAGGYLGGQVGYGWANPRTACLLLHSWTKMVKAYRAYRQL